MIFKKAYFKKVPARIKIKKRHNNEFEGYDLDLAKIQRPAGKSKKPTIRRTYIEKNTFDWRPRKKTSFQPIKDVITNNAVIGGDPNLQFHFSVDALQTDIGEVLY